MTRRATPARPTKRRAGRFAAVQALYQIELTGAAPPAVIEEFLTFRMEATADKRSLAREADPAMFAELVEGAWRQREQIDALLKPALAQGWTLERIEVVLHAALRAGIYELIARADVPARVVINEYVDIARLFSGEKEAAFVNSVLDRIGRTLRPDELGPAPADGESRAKEAAPVR